MDPTCRKKSRSYEEFGKTVTVEVALGAVALRDAVVAGLADQEKQVFDNPLEMLGQILIVLADFSGDDLSERSWY